MQLKNGNDNNINYGNDEFDGIIREHKNKINELYSQCAELHLINYKM